MSVSKIIQQVKSHPEIWQASHKRYKDKTARDRAWKEIAKNVGKDDVSVRKRWKNLKDAFRKELKRILVKEIETSSWHYFEELTFITDAILRGIRQKDISKMPCDDANDEHGVIGDSDDPLCVKLELVPEPGTSETFADDSHDNTNISMQPNEMKMQQTKRKVLDDEYDADYMFLVSLLPTMRKLSDVQKLQFRGQINQWLLDAVSPNINLYHKQHENKVEMGSDDSFE